MAKRLLRWLSTFIVLFMLLLGCDLWSECQQWMFSFVNNEWRSILVPIMTYVPRVIFLLFLFLLFKLVSSLVINVFLRRRHRHSQSRLWGISKLLRFFWWVLFVVICIGVLFGNVTGILTSLGLIGFGLTFALQKPILNFVGWLTIVLKGIYHEGDRVKIGSVRGDVKDIQTMNTVLEGLLPNSDLPSGKLVIVPNEMVLTTDIENYTENSNYIIEELSITITYESDYEKAMELLRKIVIQQIRKNKSAYKKYLVKQQAEINAFIRKLLRQKQKSKRAEEQMEREAAKLQEQKEKVQHEVEDIGEEFRPKIRVELLDSAIQLIAQFTTPYNAIKKNRTEINLAFLEAIKKEKKIEIAYPHLQLVTKGKTK